MHDPSTQAFDIAIFKHPILSIWHVDPETDGSDDSCGWFAPRMTEDDLAWAKDLAGDAFDLPKPGLPSFEYVAALWPHIRKRVSGTHLRDDLTARDMAQILALVSCPWDNIRGLVGEAMTDPREMVRLICCLWRAYSRSRRPWYRHPRWHVRHWRFQWHDLQAFNRWAFSRCAACGGRFPWGYSPISNGWNDERTRFGKGEKGIYHHRCFSGGKVALTREEP